MDDQIGAIRFLLENPKSSGTYNLTAPNPVTNKDIARSIGRQMRRPSFFVLPSFLMKLILGELSTTVLDGQRVIPQKLIDEGYSFHFPRLELALKDLLP